MSDLIERLRDFDPIEGALRGLPIQQEAADEIERLTAKLEGERDTWDGHKVCELLRSDLAGALAKVEKLEAVVDAAKIFLAQHDSGDDATSELELLDEALAATEQDLRQPSPLKDVDTFTSDSTNEQGESDG